MGHRIAVLRDGILQQLDTPQSLYDHPANMFVAGFIGSPSMNFFDAKVVTDGGADDLYVEVGTLRLKVPNHRINAVKSLAGREVVFGIRPEDIHHPSERLEAPQLAIHQRPRNRPEGAQSPFCEGRQVVAGRRLHVKQPQHRVRRLRQIRWHQATIGCPLWSSQLCYSSVCCAVGAGDRGAVAVGLRGTCGCQGFGVVVLICAGPTPQTRLPETRGRLPWQTFRD